MARVIRQYMTAGARVRVIRKNPLLQAEIGDEATVVGKASDFSPFWRARFDDGHEESIFANWVEVLESPNTQEYDLTPLPAFLPRPEPLRPGRRYCLHDALPELRQWLRDVERGLWPERAYRFWAEDATRDNPQSLATRVPASDRIVASHQAAVLRRMIDETETALAKNSWSEPEDA